MNKKEKRSILIIVGIVIFLIIIGSIIFVGKKESTAEKIGVILSGSVEEEGWNGMHYLGFKNSCETLGVEMLVKDNVKEFSGQCENAIRELVEEGASMIVLSSYGYSKEVYEVVKEYPEIVFYGNSSEYHDKNLTSYFVRMYQARYLAGIIAGMKTSNDCIGYVAAMENNEVNRGINAFTLGVRRVNPDAVVNVIWTGTWDNEEEETRAAKTLIEKADVDVITYHQNQSYVVNEAERQGVYSIGYHVPLESASSKYLTTVVCNWEVLYREIIKQFLQGKGNTMANFWIGLEKDVIRLDKYSEEVTDEIVIEVEAAKEEILQGKEVFSGVIYDNLGNRKCEEDEIIRDEILLEQFDWFVEGVNFYEE